MLSQKRCIDSRTTAKIEEETTLLVALVFNNSENRIKFIKDLECDTDIKRSPNLSFRVKLVHWPDVVWPGWLMGDAIGTDQL